MGSLTREAGVLPETDVSGMLRVPIQAVRGMTNFGLRYRRLGTGTIQVTGGDSVEDTYLPTVNGVAIVSAAVTWETSHNNTAAKIATAINAMSATSGYGATVATDTVTVYQLVSGAIVGSLACTVASDATVVVADFSNDTDTWTTHAPGATLSATGYYELSWNPALVTPMNISDAKLLDMNLYSATEAWQYWCGRLNMVSNVIAGGIDVAADTWELIENFAADVRIIVKMANDSAFNGKQRYI